MKWLLLLITFACSVREVQYRTPHEWVGTGGGFMHVVKHEGVIYYYRLEEVPPHLKLHLMLQNTNDKPVKLYARDFALLISDQQIAPHVKSRLVKEKQTGSLLLAEHDQKLALHELTLIDRFMMEDEFHLVSDSPTKTYLLFSWSRPTAQEFSLKLGPGASWTKVVRKP